MGLLKQRFQLFFLIPTLLFATNCSETNNHLYGYIEGEYTYIASGVSGTLFNLFVTRGQMIKQGDILYALDPEPEQASVKETKANIADFESQLAFAKIQLERQKELLLKRAAAQTDVDQAQTTFNSRIEQLAGSRAQLIQSEWALQQKTQYAPRDGLIFDTFYRVGEKVQADHPVLALLFPDNIKVLFYIPETSLSQFKLGQKIYFNCDGCSHTTEATISYISPEAQYTPPVIYSKDTRYKLVYLIRAKIPKDIAFQYHPGQPIDVYLHK